MPYFSPYGYDDCTFITSGHYCKIYEGKRKIDNKEVILKIPKSNPPKEEEIASLEHEVRIMELLHGSPSVPRLYTKEKYEFSPLLVMEKIDSPTLSKLLSGGKKMEVTDFLGFALAAIAALENVHSFHIIHKDISEFNILYNPKKRECKIIDFGLSVPIDHQRVIPVNPEIIQGTLAYISPEQTGRTTPGIDYRSDYYSLGIAFYRAITGKLPFEQKKAIDMVHDHISSLPEMPRAIVPTLPKVIEEFVMKMMAKDPEDRYQSIAGMRSDLLQCVERLKDGEIEYFPIGKKDIFERFQIPGKIYGREEEVEELVSIYRKVERGASAMVLLSGYSGVGKTSLVAEMENSIFSRHGWVVSGKFEQFKRNTPYFAFNQAFESFIKFMMTQPDSIYRPFRDKILQAMGNSAQIIIDAVPIVEKVIGKQPPVPSVGLVETQNRFAYIFQKFIECLPRRERPLVIFLDDIQWADPSSMRLIKKLLEIQCPYLMVIGGYRDNELTIWHPLHKLLIDLEKERMPYQKLELKPLKPASVRELVADVVHKREEEVEDLSLICFDKTGGNPFFINKLLEDLYTKDLLFYDWNDSEWKWKIEKIRSSPATKNLVELMKEKIEEIPYNLISLLQIAACIGSRFSIDTVMAVTPLDEMRVRSELEELLKLKFITCYEKQYYRAKNFHFIHDSVRQASFEMIQPENRFKIHLKIAKHLEEETPNNKLSDVIFDIVEHYNWAIEIEKDQYRRYRRDERLIKNYKERKHIAQQNFQAALIAKEAAAYDSALNYCKLSYEWIGRENWERDHEFLMELYYETMECAYLCKEFSMMDLYGKIIISRSKNSIEKCRAMKIEGLYYNSIGDHEKAISILMEALWHFRLIVPRNPTNRQVAIRLIGFKIKQLKKYREVSDLSELPVMEHSESEIIQDLISELNASSYLSGRKNLFVLLLIEALELSLKYGNSVKSAVFYAGYGMALIDMGFVNSGYEFGKLALKIAGEFNDQKGQTTAILIVWIFIAHWKESLHTLLPELHKNYELSLEAGNNHIATYGLVTWLSYSLFSGLPISKMKEELHSYKKIIMQIKNNDAIGWFNLIEEFTERLSTKSGALFSGKSWSEPLDITGKATVCVYNQAISYLFRDFDEALKSGEEFPKYREGLTGNYLNTVHLFYLTLTLTATIDKYPYFERRKKKKIIKEGIKAFKKYAKYAPQNHLHKYLLLKAEKLRIAGWNKRAEMFYKKAIDASIENKFINEEAVATELFARFYLAQNKRELANKTMKNASLCYKEWGATNKLKQLKEEFPSLITTGE